MGFTPALSAPAAVDADRGAVHEWLQKNSELQGIAAMSLSRPSLIPGWLLLPALLLATGSARATPPTITVGTVELSYCNTDYLGYCGSIKRQLDPHAPAAGTLTIGFECYPRRDQSVPAIGTILPQEGGPVYSSTGTRDAYINIFEALRDHRDILI